MLQNELTETTTEDKIRRLVSFFTPTPFDDITMDFNIREGIDKDADYFNTMMAGALAYHFGVETEAEDIESMTTVQDLVNRINENQ